MFSKPIIMKRSDKTPEAETLCQSTDYGFMLTKMTHEANEFCKMLNEQVASACPSRGAQINQALQITQHALSDEFQDVHFFELGNISDPFAPLDEKTNLMLVNDPIDLVVMHANAMASSAYDCEQQFAKLVASPVVTKQSGFGVAPSIWGPQLHFSAIGGKPVKLSLMSHLHTSNLAMADFSRERLEQLPLLQPLVLLVKQILNHNDFSKNANKDTPLSTNAIFLLANCYLSRVQLECAEWSIGEALLGFLKHHCIINHKIVAFGLGGVLAPRLGNFFEDELFLPMPGPCLTNCATGFRSLNMLKEVFRHTYRLLLCGKPLRQVLSSRKYKLFKGATGSLERFVPSDSLYIGGLPSTASEADVSRMIESVLQRPPHRVLIRQKSPDSPKHSFVWVGDVESAQRCVRALNDKSAKGIYVNFAAPSKIMQNMPTTHDATENQHIPKSAPAVAHTAVEFFPSTMHNNYNNFGCMPPPLVASPFPMVLMPLYCGVPQQGLPLVMPFCMPPVRFNKKKLENKSKSDLSEGGTLSNCSDSIDDDLTTSDTCSLSSGASSDGDNNDSGEEDEKVIISTEVGDKGIKALKKMMGLNKTASSLEGSRVDMQSTAALKMIMGI